jgi:hypothetical protein
LPEPPNILLWLRFSYIFPSYHDADMCVWIVCYQRTNQCQMGLEGRGLLCICLHETGWKGKGSMYISMRYQAPEFFSLVQSLLPEFSAVSARGGGAYWRRGHPLGVGWEIRQPVNNSSSVRESINQIQLISKEFHPMLRPLLLWCLYVAEKPQWQKLHFTHKSHH